MVDLFMKKKVFTFTLIIGILLLIGYGFFSDFFTPEDKTPKLIVASSSQVPHGDILNEVVKPLLAEEGIALEVRVITGGEVNDYLVQQQIDANFFQHLPYLEAYNLDHDTDLISVASIHIEPFGAYSSRHSSLTELPDGAEIVIPQDPSNHSRALLLLHRENLIAVDDPEDPLTHLHDIVDNPKNFTIREMDAAMMVRILDQVDLALINSNYVLSAGMNPARDALAMEDAHSPYVNILVIRPEDQANPLIESLAKALTSSQVKAYIEEHWPGAVLPVF